MTLAKSQARGLLQLNCGFVLQDGKRISKRFYLGRDKKTAGKLAAWIKMQWMALKLQTKLPVWTPAQLQQIALQRFQMLGEGDDMPMMITPVAQSFQQPSLPVMNEIKQDTIAVVSQTANQLQMSVNEAAEYFGLDIPYDARRDRIYVINTMEAVLKDEPVPVAPVAAPAPSDNEEDQETVAPSKESQKEAKAFIDAFRKLALDASDEGRIFRLADADALLKELFPNDAMHTAIRYDHANLKKLLADKTDKDQRAVEVKKYFNAKNRQFIKSILGASSVNETN